MLELEGEVQQDPTNHEAWHALGLKQQENEREDQAILALTKAIELCPSWRPPYLALAVSYTNEGDPSSANAMMERWLDIGVAERTGTEVSAGGINASLNVGQGVGGDSRRAVAGAARERLINRLIDLARTSPDEVEADVQIALGVLFNACEVCLSPSRPLLRHALMTGIRKGSGLLRVCPLRSRGRK